MELIWFTLAKLGRGVEKSSLPKTTQLKWFGLEIIADARLWKRVKAPDAAFRFGKFHQFHLLRR